MNIILDMFLSKFKESPGRNKSFYTCEEHPHLLHCLSYCSCCNNLGVKTYRLKTDTQTASKSVLTAPAFLLPTNSHTQGTDISGVTLCLDKNYRPVLQPHCWAKQSLSTTPPQEKGNLVYQGSAVPCTLPEHSTV